MFSTIAPAGRSRRTATLCSAVLHAAAVGAIWAVGQVVTAPTAPRYEPREAVAVVSPTSRLLSPRRRPKAPLKRFEVEHTPVPRARERALPKPEAPAVEVVPAPAPIMTHAPEVSIPNPAAKPVGFAEAARAPTPKLELEPRGAAFGAALGRPGQASVVPLGAAAGFGAADVAQAKAPAAAGVDGGFGGAQAGRIERRTAAAQEAGFGAAERGLSPATASSSVPAASKNRPVKILWKPVPQYSEEGISRRIEGDVVLLVRFLAQGKVETIKIVRALGHGLDEYALQAAQAIRFEPATEDDRPVDYTAQVRIRFELAY